jgi:signal transduction histidine kinase
VWATGLGLYLLGGLFAILWFVRQSRANRMQADFVAAVSHEMKTPIAGIQAMAEMLADGRVPDPARAHAYAERIRAEASRLGAGVRNVLDAARIERDPSSVVRPVPTEPSALVLDLADVLRPVLEGRGFRFTVSATPSPRPIPIDPDAFGSVVGNLLDNAAKFSTETKEIDVDAGPVANGYRVTVSDRGPGVPREERERIFERFERGEHARKMAVPGVGLGLHVACNLVKAHGGTIEVLDRDGGSPGLIRPEQGRGGAAFVVTWPGGASS